MTIVKKVKTSIAGVMATFALVGTVAPAHAKFTINLIDNGGVTGSQAEMGFKIAKSYWESVLLPM